MDLFDFFFPEQAQASHLRKIANQRSTSPVPRQTNHSQEISGLQSDVKFLTLVVTAILKRLAETETLSLVDVKDLLSEIDGLDGVPDGGLDTGVLRGLLGILKEEEEQNDPADEIRIDTSRSRYRR